MLFRSDLNFSGITESSVVASISFSINRTGSMQVYHYSQGPEAGFWEALPKSSSGNQRLWATIEENQDETEITIFSKGGVGSPFLVGPLSVPNIVKAGGGGGCSVSSGDQQTPSWFLSFLMTLALLVGWAYLNKAR